jgi:hypothetical protein
MFAGCVTNASCVGTSGDTRNELLVVLGNPVLEAIKVYVPAARILVYCSGVCAKLFCYYAPKETLVFFPAGVRIQPRDDAYLPGSVRESLSNERLLR